jgi:hypothetical protein
MEETQYTSDCFLAVFAGRLLFAFWPCADPQPTTGGDLALSYSGRTESARAAISISVLVAVIFGLGIY